MADLVSPLQPPRSGASTQLANSMHGSVIQDRPRGVSAIASASSDVVIDIADSQADPVIGGIPEPRQRGAIAAPTSSRDVETARRLHQRFETSRTSSSSVLDHRTSHRAASSAPPTGRIAQSLESVIQAVSARHGLTGNAQPPSMASMAMTGVRAARRMFSSASGPLQMVRPHRSRSPRRNAPQTTGHDQDYVLAMQLQLEEQQLMRADASHEFLAAVTHLQTHVAERTRLHQDLDAHPGTGRGRVRQSLQRRILSNDGDFNSNDYEMLLELDEAARHDSVSPDEHALSAASMISCLPSRRIDESEATRADKCSICLETMDAGAEVRTLPCLHTFHCACIDRWLKMPGQPKCPIDQVVVSLS